MGIYLAEQTLLFLQSILIGAAFGLVYDIFRITRIAVPTAGWAVFAEDVLFFFICAVSTFFFFMRTIDGQVRFFILLGEGLGALLYFVTLSILVMRVSTAIINAVKAVCRFVLRWLLTPIWRLLYNIVLLIIRPARFLGRFLKKSTQRCKYRLKVRRAILYNHLRGVFAVKTPKKKRKPRDNGKSKKNP